MICTKVSDISSNMPIKMRRSSSLLLVEVEGIILQEMICRISPSQKSISLGVLRISLLALLKDSKNFVLPSSTLRSLSLGLLRGKLSGLLLLNLPCSTEFLLLKEHSSMHLWLPWPRVLKCVLHSPSLRFLDNIWEKISSLKTSR